MSQWSPAFVVATAAKAGFSSDNLVDAASLAWAVSNGQDAYSYNPTVVPGIERRGLWGIMVADVAEGEAHRLYEPDFCAQAAHYLWSTRGPSFSWHPAWINGEAAKVRPIFVDLTGRATIPPIEFAQGRFAQRLEGIVEHQYAMAALKRSPYA